MEVNYPLLSLVPWLPLVGAIVCGLCCFRPSLDRFAGWACVVSIAASFICVLLGWPAVGDYAQPNILFDWIHVGAFDAPMGYFVDGLTMLMLLVVTGVGLLISLYAIGYMKGDRGYARFFAGVALFIFAMTTLVMADNLVLLYLGWEGVGLCSYLLIGHYYDQPEAVAAAKKAFIVNRIGDFGFLMGILLTYHAYGTVSIPAIVAQALDGGSSTAPWATTWIPYLLMLGAFGKSAQIPLHVWLPDAMAGPTPVSALVHAATMVTAGVYMIARLLPVFALSPYALPTVALIGGLTAIFAATIALCQYDLKKIWAYSTVSQLGYMFLGVGAASAFSGVFHLFTHAFFKALLFLTAGSVMHALAGQLDLRQMSGLRRRMPVTAFLMLIGAAALAGFPLITAGFFSKDAILAATFERGLGEQGEPIFLVLGVLGLITAFLTAFYSFRLWFRVFAGPEHFEMGGEPHHPAEAEQAAAADPAQAPDAAGHGHVSGAAPHEMPWWPMNAPLVVLAIGAIAAGYLGLGGEHHGVVGQMVHDSTARLGAHTAADDAAAGAAWIHTAMMVVSGLLALAGIALAWYFHLHNRAAADNVAQRFRGVVATLYNRYYVDELYERVVVTPLRLLGFAFYVVDQLVIHSLVLAVGWVPRLAGFAVRPAQHGRLQGYGLGMVTGVAVVLVLVLFVVW